MKKVVRTSVVFVLIFNLAYWSPLAIGAGYSTSLPVVEVSNQKVRAKGKGLFGLGLFSKREKPATAATTAKGKNTFAGACSKLSSLVKPQRNADRRSRSKRTDSQLPHDFQVYVNNTTLARSNGGSNTQMHIDISEQRAYLLVDGQVGLEMPVSTARAGKYTPRGTFQITERVRNGKISTLYHVEMPYWQRLGNSVFGVHAGYLPGTPASAGCVRLPVEGAQIAFDHMARGVPVSIHDQWSPEQNRGARR